ncbi:PIN domain-containing protein [Roseofilum casamattae]|uniref:PIN domain-containing protein n=1 Tax=Roseofilum casamattae BLCC-M143 TaxID=3022442 RepID=A0ABT7C152_9CYAN|nr:PIN domain-containing protein [Roseofilum casamattae]MDJ1184416.1 PIN domain-containing protein [Roseofilum casamattae BLCC-M143]
MKLVVDANILVGELLRIRGRKLLKSHELELYAAQRVLEETRYELRRRMAAMRNKGLLSQETEEELFGLVNSLIENYIELVEVSSYSSFEAEARKRIPRDPDDWPTVAAALALSAAIWTQDYDFFGCGCPTWTTETLLLQLRDE